MGYSIDSVGCLIHASNDGQSLTGTMNIKLSQDFERYMVHTVDRSSKFPRYVHSMVFICGAESIMCNLWLCVN